MFTEGAGLPARPDRRVRPPQLLTEGLTSDRPHKVGPALALRDREQVPPDSGGTDVSPELSRLLFRGLDGAQDLVLITEAEPIEDPGPRILYVNGAVERMTGYTCAEVIGRTPRLLHGPGTSRETLNRIREALKERRPLRAELLIYCKDGTTFWVELCMVPIPSAGVCCTHWLAIVRDISAQIADRERVLETDRKLHSITESVPSLLWALTPEGRCAFVSGPCARYLGISPEASLQHQWIDFLHPEDRETFLREWHRAARGQQAFVQEYRLRRHDGSFGRFAHRSAPRRDGAGHIVEWAGVSDDISEQKESENALREREKLTIMGRMASTLSHEINNPLAAVTNVLFLLERNPSLDDLAREYLETAQQQLARVAETARAQLQFQQRATETGEINLTDVLEDLLRLSKPRLDSKQIAVKKQYRGETTVQCYEMELRQALRHVLHNALDAVPIRGTVSVRVRPGREWRPQGRNGVRVTIADTGAGIPKQARGRLFEAFFTTKGMNGTGLGLWLAKGIVDRHEGSIRIRTSTKPKRSGTSVVLFLPTPSQG